MPRASDYRIAAHAFRSGRDRFAEAAWRDRSVPTLAAAGPLVERSTAAALAIRHLYLRASVEFSELAAVCDRRAEVCDAYAAEVAAYERLDLWHRIGVPRPRRPADWVDA